MKNKISVEDIIDLLDERAEEDYIPNFLEKSTDESHADFRRNINRALDTFGIPFQCTAPASPEEEDCMLFLVLDDYSGCIGMLSIQRNKVSKAVWRGLLSVADIVVNVMEDVFEWSPEEAIDMLHSVIAVDIKSYDEDEIETVIEDLEHDELPDLEYWLELQGSLAPHYVAFKDESDDWKIGDSEKELGLEGLKRNFTHYVFSRLQ